MLIDPMPPPVMVPAPPPPPIQADPLAPPGSPQSRFWIWTPGEASCSGSALDLSGLEQPEPASLRWTNEPAVVLFKIDAAGQPYGITPQLREAGIPYGGYKALSTYLDLEPSLAGSRFAAGAPQDQCRISYELKAMEFTRATLAQKLEWATSVEGAQREPFILTQLLSGDSTCNDQLYPRVIHYPPFDEFPGRRGHNGKILVFFDVDSAGVPINIRVAHSTATAKADKLAIDAMARTRFARSAKTACLQVLHHPPGEVVKAPPLEVPAALRPKDSNCPELASEVLEVANVPYPEGFQRRAIEGWAIVQFDLVSGLGPVRVKALQAEPAAAFGVQAEEVVKAAKARDPRAAYHGCVTRVLFKLPDSGPYGVFNGNR